MPDDDPAQKTRRDVLGLAAVGATGFGLNSLADEENTNTTKECEKDGEIISFTGCHTATVEGTGWDSIHFAVQPSGKDDRDAFTGQTKPDDDGVTKIDARGQVAGPDAVLTSVRVLTDGETILGKRRPQDSQCYDPITTTTSTTRPTTSDDSEVLGETTAAEETTTTEWTETTTEESTATPDPDETTASGPHGTTYETTTTAADKDNFLGWLFGLV